MLTINKIKTKIQNLGSLLSSSVLPIIGIFIAWGLLTSFFIPTGWIPNKTLSTMVGIGITYIIPTLIGFLLGKKIYNIRGGAIAGIVALATIAAGQTDAIKYILYEGINEDMLQKKSGVPMFLGVMIFAPIASLVLKHTEKLWIQKIKPGFEMLVNNFYLGILGFILVFPVFYASIYVIGYFQLGLSKFIFEMQKYKLYPILAIIIEPAKILFLNNAINHGVFTPLGTAQVLEAGKSTLFLLESNPGPGLGILITWIIFGFKKNKAISSQAASSSVVHLFGGIHEVYFPFVLLRPILIFPLIAGGAIGNLIFLIFNAGAIAPISPGSIIAGFIQINKTWSDVLGYTLGIAVSAAVTAVLSLFILLFFRKKDLSKIFEEATDNSKAMKNNLTNKFYCKNIVFACDAGMGSSAMGSSIFKKTLKDNDINNITVINKAINNLTNSDKCIITISSLRDRIKQKVPSSKIITINQFLDQKKYQEIVQEIKNEKK
ncbi:PTS mannitol transporter subunit IICB [Mesomycoplasma neurolyticum]|uniref:PTS system mannitol-specific EIICB component n=1 Tax=Mesomycoplasma neurolyticum TaxID=2120 RepID=A0A449A5J0_9BACT|nr:PTS mannitol transporter subunit IICB [Mesomycoplasma neurolyticum]VEU59492.1 PTS system mannitol-specific (MtlA)-like IIB domain protein [Mesomycoplasma neurolyticum]